MNDRFKFRVWGKDQKIMKECTQITLDKEQKGSMCDVKGKVTAHLIYQPHYILMQCTGLKDKNGKLIYEGDILQSEEYPFKNEKGYNYAAEVLWDDASATFYYYTFRISNNVAGRSTGNTGELNEYEDWKVIGNIYENKELLESEG